MNPCEIVNLVYCQKFLYEFYGVVIQKEWTQKEIKKLVRHMRHGLRGFTQLSLYNLAYSDTLLDHVDSLMSDKEKEENYKASVYLSDSTVHGVPQRAAHAEMSRFCKAIILCPVSSVDYMKHKARCILIDANVGKMRQNAMTECSIATPDHVARLRSLIDCMRAMRCDPTFNTPYVAAACHLVNHFRQFSLGLTCLNKMLSEEKSDLTQQMVARYNQILRNYNVRKTEPVFNPEIHHALPIADFDALFADFLESMALRLCDSEKRGKIEVYYTFMDVKVVHEGMIEDVERSVVIAKQRQIFMDIKTDGNRSIKDGRLRAAVTLYTHVIEEKESELLKRLWLEDEEETYPNWKYTEAFLVIEYCQENGYPKNVLELKVKCEQLLLRAAAYILMKNPSVLVDAIHDLNTVLELDPDNHRALQWRVWCIRRRERAAKSSIKAIANK